MLMAPRSSLAVGEGFAGELAILIGVEHLRFFIPVKAFFQCLGAERNVDRDRHPQSQHAAAGQDSAGGRKTLRAIFPLSGLSTQTVVVP